MDGFGDMLLSFRSICVETENSDKAEDRSPMFARAIAWGVAGKRGL